MAEKDSSQKLLMFFPDQVFLSHNKEPGEFKQSRSNGCLGSSEMNALKKHISLEKIMQIIPSKNASRINLKKSAKQLGRGSAKDKESETPMEHRIRIGFKSYQGHHNEIGSPFMHSKAVPVATDQGKPPLKDRGSVSHDKRSKRESFKPKLTFENAGSSSQKFIKGFASPTASKQARVGIGKNMSDLTGAKGKTTRTRPMASNFAALEKVQSNMSNKSGTKVMDGGNCKFSFTAVDFSRTMKIEKCKLEKLLGKESNKSAIFSTNKGFQSQPINHSMGQNSKDKQFNGQRCGRNGRGNSPQPHMEMIRKGGYGSYTSSTLQTVSLMNSDSPDKFRMSSDVSGQLCQTKFTGYDWQGGIYYLVHFEETYDAPAFLSQFSTPQKDEETLGILKLMRGYSITETNESKFFLPKASMISVEGCSSIEICHELLNLNLEVTDPEKKDPSFLCKANEATEEFNYGEPGYALGLLDTPSFTAGPCKSDDFTFGRVESKEEAQGPNRQATESAFSSINNEFERLEVISEADSSSKEVTIKGRRVNTQRDYNKVLMSAHSQQNLPLSDRHGSGHHFDKEVFLPKAGVHRSNYSHHNMQLQGIEGLGSGDRSSSRGNCDHQDSAEDSERYNLYKNLYVSDSEDCDYEVPRSDFLSESEESSHKGKIYSRFDEGCDVDSSQLFLDEELRNKYQSLLQNN